MKFRIHMHSSPGIWKYSLVVDGQWVAPPDAQVYETDGFGGRNAVLIVQ